MQIAEEPTEPRPQRVRVFESLFCLADGVVDTRGVLEEASETGDVVAGVVASGLYEPAAGVGDQLATLPRWYDLPLSPGIGTGWRVLDLRDGLLHRILQHAPGTALRPGNTLRTVRFASATRPGTAILVADLDRTALSGPLPSGFDPELRQCRTGNGGGAVLARSTLQKAIGSDGEDQMTLQRIGFYAVSASHMPSAAAAVEGLSAATNVGAAGLLAEQRACWARRWEGADVMVVGDATTTRALRFALFHVLSSAGRGAQSAVGARGLSGPAYAGHVLWDTEVFVLPVLAAIDERAARSVLGYRLDRLAPARRRAAGEGRRGTRFPWESAHSGDDVTPRSGVDQDGHTVPIRTGDLEMHITADVAWAAWRYGAWRGDWAFLDGPGRPLVLEPARYWAGRVRWDEDHHAHIDRVIGPDEYHEDVDDNTFTNLIVRWNLRRAAELVERRIGARSPAAAVAGNSSDASNTGAQGRIDAGEDLEKSAEEAAHWRQIADSLVDGYDPSTGRYEQFSGYDQLEPLLVSAIGTPPVAADLVLGHDRLAGTQIVKQADVLMAHYMIPEETETGSLLPNLEHYLPRTAHGSSLSPAVHAALLARAGRSDEALDLLSLAIGVDLDDLTRTTAGGLHLANLGGLWQAVVHGFVGVQLRSPDDPALVVDPQLPDAWPELRVGFRWHGRQVHLTCRHDQIYVRCETVVPVTLHGTTTRIEPPGRWIR